MLPAIAETLARAKAQHAAGRLPESLALYEEVIRAEAADVEARYLSAAVLHTLGRLSEAETTLHDILRLRPEHADAHNYLGALRLAQGDCDGALANFERAVQLASDSVQFVNNRDMTYADRCNRQGNALLDEERLAEAGRAYRQALERKPDLAETHFNLGVWWEKQDQVADALSCYRRAVELEPDFAEAHNNLGAMRSRENDFVGAEACFRRAIELQPDYVDAHYNLALTLLSLGRLVEGWAEHEWRLQRPGMGAMVGAGARWGGQDLAGRTILLYGEQGLGDTLQFVRYSQLVKQRGGKVIVAVPPALARLVASCASVDRVVFTGESLPAFQLHAPLVSLPLVFRTSLETIPATVPYLSPLDSEVQAWKRELASEPGFKVGIFWQGNPAYPLDRLRSIPLAHFARLAEVPGVRLYSLQKGPGREQLAALADSTAIVDLGDRLGDFQQTAAILRNLDLVISCDSSLVHLAGALAVPVWVALSFSADSRWMLDREDSPWYPTARLFRQPRVGGWPDVFARLAAALAGAV